MVMTKTLKAADQSPWTVIVMASVVLTENKIVAIIIIKDGAGTGTYDVTVGDYSGVFFEIK